MNMSRLIFDANDNPWFSKTEKLRPEQIAQRSTWGRVPDIDMAKATQYVITVRPSNGSTVTEMFELDPGISGATVGEGRGWSVIPSAEAPVAIHGRGSR
ncbi:MAG: hypothetical protein ACREMY_00070 [bacterium]